MNLYSIYTVSYKTPQLNMQWQIDFCRLILTGGRPSSGLLGGWR